MVRKPPDEDQQYSSQNITIHDSIVTQLLWDKWLTQLSLYTP